MTAKKQVAKKKAVKKVVKKVAKKAVKKKVKSKALCATRKPTVEEVMTFLGEAIPLAYMMMTADKNHTIQCDVSKEFDNLSTTLQTSQKRHDKNYN